MTNKQRMNKFASWLCRQEGLKVKLKIGDAREIWKILNKGQMLDGYARRR